jgi:hypothetical protein
VGRSEVHARVYLEGAWDPWSMSLPQTYKVVLLGEGAYG